MISDVWIGWTAGILDGEGSICIIGVKRNDTASANTKYYAFVEVTNTDIAMIKKLQELWGGYISNHRDERGNCRNTYRWFVKSYNLFNVLKSCLPHLVTKKKQAELALSFQQRVFDNKRIFWGKALPTEEILLRHDMCSQMRQLNVRGTSWSESPQSAS